MKKFDCIIVGAGISGIMAAKKLLEAGLNTLIIDKGRNVGGRMATRVVGKLHFDHGAQVISANSNEISTLLQNWINMGIIQITPYKKSGFDENNDTSYYSVKNGIVELPRFLVSEMNVVTSIRVVKLSCDKNKWIVKTSDNGSYSANIVILTPPVPQSLELIKESDIEIPKQIHSDLSGIKYERCISLLVEGNLLKEFSEHPYIKPEQGIIKLIINNYKKRVSFQTGPLTVHTTSEFSLKFWDANDNKIIDAVFQGAKSYLRSQNGYLKIHKWRYSRTINSYPEPYLIVHKPGFLAFAGDGFSSKDIEGAALSGLRVAEQIMSILN